MAIQKYPTSKGFAGNANNSKLLIHATNLNGYGAQQVVVSLLDALAAIGGLRGSVIEISEVVREKVAGWQVAGADVRFFQRALPNSISRLLECLFARRERKLYSHILVLGDIPLPGVHGQTVLVHQPNLISPELNAYSSRKFLYRIMRWIFKRNTRFAMSFVMQTDVMQKQMLETFPELKGRIMVIPQPAPTWLKRIAAKKVDAQGKRLRIFYPAAGLLYKNHVLLKGMDLSKHLMPSIELTVTLTPSEQARLGLITGWLRNVGKVKPDDCREIYEQSDALFFPSLLESYGLPLVEAMTLGLPIVCSDLPYARWLCEDQAIYFDPFSPELAWDALRELQRRLSGGWQPDWAQAMSKLPKDWDEVARHFLDVMKMSIGGTQP